MSGSPERTRSNLVNQEIFRTMAANVLDVVGLLGLPLDRFEREIRSVTDRRGNILMSNERGDDGILLSHPTVRGWRRRFRQDADELALKGLGDRGLSKGLANYISLRGILLEKGYSSRDIEWALSRIDVEALRKEFEE